MEQADLFHGQSRQRHCFSRNTSAIPLATTGDSALRPFTRAPHAREGLPCTHVFGSCDAYAICVCPDAFLQLLCLPYSTFRYITFYAQQAGRSLGIINKCVQFASSAYLKTSASLHPCQFHLVSIPYRQKHTTTPLQTRTAASPLESETRS